MTSRSPFKDHFSAISKAYQSYRPTYPEALFEFLASAAPGRGMAWDCGTGNGQAAMGLARHFERVVATDASREQVSQATHVPNIEYIVTPAERTPIQAGSVDLITVAQALHWFDIYAFFEEADRVLKTGGILAVWSYNLLRVEPAVDDLIDRFAHETVGSYWPKERALVEANYSTITFPFDAIVAPAFEMEAYRSMTDILSYVGTWSSVQRYRQIEKRDPVKVFEASLAKVWSGGRKRVVWPVALFVRRKTVSTEYWVLSIGY